MQFAHACYQSTMFGLGFSEILVIAVVILLVVGPEKLPEFMQMLGKNIRKVRNASDELKDSLKINLDE